MPFNPYTVKVGNDLVQLSSPEDETKLYSQLTTPVSPVGGDPTLWQRLTTPQTALRTTMAAGQGAWDVAKALPSVLVNTPGQIGSDVKALWQNPTQALADMGERAKSFALAQLPFKETATTALKGEIPSAEQVGREAGQLGASLALPKIGGGLVKRGARAFVKELPGAGVELQAQAIPQSEALARRLGAGQQEELASSLGVEDATTAARGQQIQGGLKDIAQAHRVGEAVEWEFPRTAETGVPDFSIDNLREFMRSRRAEAGDVRQAINPQTSAKTVNEGGFRTPEGAFVTERPTRAGVLPSQLAAGLAQGEGPITLRQAMALRKTLGELHESGDRGPLAAFRQDMNIDATANPARADAWQKARDYTRERIVPFYSDQPLGRLINKGEPVAVVDALLRPKDQGITNLQAVAKQTGEQGPTWEAIRQEATARSLNDPTTLEKLGPETKNLLFPPEVQARISRQAAANDFAGRVNASIGVSGQGFSSHSVNQLLKWVDQQERAVSLGRPDATAKRFVEAFTPAERMDIRTTLTELARNAAALPNIRGAPVGSSQRALHWSVGELAGNLAGHPGVGGLAAIGTGELISRGLQTGRGRAFIRQAMKIDPSVGPLFTHMLGALLRGEANSPRR